MVKSSHPDSFLSNIKYLKTEMQKIIMINMFVLLISPFIIFLNDFLSNSRGLSNEKFSLEQKKSD